ncbi:Hypothetical predicted protein [Paramuricea clavata]|uniref:Uncharacterized protein n=1 Tax=Paramuricea clavata TaxID=317549 RepID=A0A6S7GHL8_PARCT|nr:Hypothetical predicted protein [Paramuricea clavata]
MERRAVIYSILEGIIKNGRVIRSACRKDAIRQFEPVNSCPACHDAKYENKEVAFLLLRKRRQRLMFRKRFWVRQIYDERESPKVEINVLVLESMLVDYEYFLPFQDVAEYF